MQDKTAPCFVVAAANDISMLPPELLRKGRFDELFFLDLPTFDERREIFTVHIRKRNRLPEDYDLETLARQTEGYVGAEIEQAVIDGMYMGFDDDREFTTGDISLAVRKQVPLSVSQSEVIEYLRSWLRDSTIEHSSLNTLPYAQLGITVKPPPSEWMVAGQRSGAMHTGPLDCFFDQLTVQRLPHRQGFFEGDLDEIEIYDWALTSEDIEALRVGHDCESLLFADGFEDGTTGGWDSVVQ